MNLVEWQRIIKKGYASKFTYDFIYGMMFPIGGKTLMKTVDSTPLGKCLNNYSKKNGWLTKKQNLCIKFKIN